jgi:hypothetical protein
MKKVSKVAEVTIKISEKKMTTMMITWAWVMFPHLLSRRLF